MKARIPGAQQGGSANMMKKIQEMQEEMARVQQEVEETEFTASAGGGAVEVTVNGRHEAVSIKMAPEIIDPEEPEMLEDLIIAAGEIPPPLILDDEGVALADPAQGRASGPGVVGQLVVRRSNEDGG